VPGQAGKPGRLRMAAATGLPGAVLLRAAAGGRPARRGLGRHRLMLYPFLASPEAGACIYLYLSKPSFWEARYLHPNVTMHTHRKHTFRLLFQAWYCLNYLYMDYRRLHLTLFLKKYYLHLFTTTLWAVHLHLLVTLHIHLPPIYKPASGAGPLPQTSTSGS